MIDFKNLSFRLIFVIFVPFFSACSFYHSQFDGLGSFLSSPDDGSFKSLAAPKNKALVYVYRPKTKWSMDEVESPSFYVNDERIFGVKGGSYTYYYLKPGDYEIVLRRPLLGFEGLAGINWHKIAEFEFNASAGKTYYFRYSELNQVKLESAQALPEGDGPLKRVYKQTAIAEMKQTQRLHRKGDTLEPLEKEEKSSWWWPF